MNIYLILTNSNTKSHSEGLALKNSRSAELENRIKTLANRLSFSPPQLSLNLLTNIDSETFICNSTIYVPYLFLIKTTDLPKIFRLNGKDDPKLQSEDFIYAAAKWTKKFLGLEMGKLTLIEKETIKIFLKFISDPVLSEKAKDFVLGHEIAHICLSHSLNNSDPYLFLKDSFISKTSGFSAALISSLSFFGYQKNAMSLRLTIFTAITAHLVIVIGQIYAKVHESKSCEKEADLMAANVSPSFKKGGIYLFNTFLNHQKTARKTGFILKLIFSPSGNNRLLYLTHPSENERVHYLKNL